MLVRITHPSIPRRRTYLLTPSHLDHCVDYLRNRLMCLSDMGLIPYFWYEKEGDLVGDMSRTFTCRNYESVRQFVKANAQKADGRVKPKEGDYVLYDYI